MLIYGSRMYFRQEPIHSSGDCDHCGAYCNFVSYKARKFGHLYFIPLIPLGPKSLVLRECKRCSMGTHIGLDDLPPVIESLTSRFKEWIGAIQQGQWEIMLPDVDESVNAGVLVAELLEDLWCLGELQTIDSIVKILEDQGFSAESLLVRGRWAEVKGNLSEASKCYQEAVRKHESLPTAWYNLGMVCLRQENGHGAEVAFERYVDLVPRDINVYIELASFYEGQKDFPKIIKAYDAIYHLEPSVLSDKGMKKIYKANK